VIEEFARILPPRAEAPAKLGGIKAREQEVLKLLARHSNAEIATTLVVTEATVKAHVAHVLTKLRIRDRVHAVIYAYESVLVQSAGHRLLGAERVSGSSAAAVSSSTASMAIRARRRSARSRGIVRGFPPPPYRPVYAGSSGWGSESFPGSPLARGRWRRRPSRTAPAKCSLRTFGLRELP
jgi:DNA-binding CsgD family transcriptional regulator